MAKLGEGDARWIVEKREDGTNVNAWHWQEKDCLTWSKRRLGQLFNGAVLVDTPRVSSTGLESLTGEVFLNNRKAKMVASYELKLTVGWTGSTLDGAQASGTIELPYLADENEDEDTEVRVVAPDDSPAGNELKNVLLRQGGREAVRKLVDQFIAELKAGVPAKEKGGATPADGAADASSGGAQAANKTQAAAAKVAAPKAAAAIRGSNQGGKVASSRARLELEKQFYCRPSDLYECFLVEGRVRAFTMSPATVDPRPGGAFTWFGGSVEGTFTELEPPRRILMNWRFSSWGEGVASRVELAMEEPEPGATVLRLTQTEIPEEDRFGNHDVKLQVERGWEEQVFKRIKQVFGFGA
ncbi:Activator heat shock protein ATPase [Monoraphidium neglectum]|uniref:Activator heat shock protein ATPase n=1 Tax=Monoraphidium neglectum TaxID=145388 RepID=A0A0D2NTG2_9CHLO|nr:Activator heat shock protein ATPase [Monoraphidium neglectum]KIZ07471.1 Activator heat shock protein ATPase [Monoraphidium neglectum]|eukprot:XP_013906490.1 Activator heat shock protein ATPase [Monoraphidium neglectum]